MSIYSNYLKESERIYIKNNKIEILKNEPYENKKIEILQEESNHINNYKIIIIYFIFSLFCLLLFLLLLSKLPKKQQRIKIKTNIYLENIKKNENITKELKINYIKQNLNININQLKYEFYKYLKVDKSSDINITTIRLDFMYQFGNSLININKAIFYCQFLGCKTIIIDRNSWYIKKPISINDITIVPYRYVNCWEKEVFCLPIGFYYFKYENLTPVTYYNYLQDEIYNNLYNYSTNSQDLFIHIRSGDIFYKKEISYAQPPLCFYKKIINENKFRKIYIFSNGKENPVIEKLTELYPNIIYKSGVIQEDVSILANCENIVLSTSTFIWGIINFSKKIKKVWNYDIISPEDKENWLITEKNNKYIKYTEYRMKPSQDYINKIYPFQANNEQKQLMINHKCENDQFEIIEPKI